MPYSLISQHSLDEGFFSVIAFPPYLKWPLRDARSEGGIKPCLTVSAALNRHEVKTFEQW
jgi:hypothetical protein